MKYGLLMILAALGLNGCSDDQQQTNNQTDSGATYAWDVPDGIALPLIPRNNPMTEEKFQLGRHLFYDTRMSANGNIACASCHHQDKAFTDGRSNPIGTYGETHPRNAQTLGNTGWYSTLNWGNPVTLTLERQVRIPMFGDTPFEHGLEEHNQQKILQTLVADPVYQQLFRAAFPGQQSGWNYVNHVTPALATFIRGMTSFNAPWDHYLLGDTGALSAQQQRGLALFSSDRLHCSQCHIADHFLSDSHVSQKDGSYSVGFHNNAAVAAYEYPNTGKFEATGDAADLGLFRTPGLRNIALTAPYMHDGSQPDLRGVILTYAAGGKSNPDNKDPLITGFNISDDEVTDLIAFLCSFTDNEFIANDRYSNPWLTAGKNTVTASVNPAVNSGVPAQCQI